MTQRERTLAIIVGGMLALLIVWWGFDKYRTAVNLRTKQIASLEQEQMVLNEQTLQGYMADRQMTEYMLRSLPSDTERAQSDYQQWLLSMVRSNNLSDSKVDPITSLPISGLYQELRFRVSGNTSLPNLIGLLHAFYSKDYLHRIRELTISQTKTNDLKLTMTIDTIALLSAPADAKPPGDTSWKVDHNVAAYHDPIMNRNFHEPPNQPPTFTGRSQIEAIVGRESPTQLAATDPEGHRIRWEFVDQPPGFVRLDSGSGTLRVNTDQKQEFELRVRAIDAGYPPRSTEQKLIVKVVDPPPPVEPPAPKLQFDDATQTVLTGLVHGRDDWTAWMHVRTKDKTLKLRVNDQFEIGSLKGKVIEVTPKFVVLEIDDRRFTLKPSGNLKEAATRSEED